MTKKVVNAEIVPDSDSASHPSATRHQRSLARLFWGLLLIVVGGLVLCDNLGLVRVHWSNIWRLWPVLIIVTGLSLLSFRSRLWKLFSVVVVIGTLAGVVYVALADFSGQITDSQAVLTVQQATEAITSAEIRIQAGASSVNVSTAPQKDIANVKFESSLMKLASNSSVVGSIQKLNFSMEGTNRWSVGDVRSIWNVNLTRDLPFSLAIDAGASDISVDTSAAKLRSLVVKAGVSALDLKVGDREDDTTVVVDSGVSTVTVRAPRSSGIRVVLDSGLTSRSLDGFSEVSNNTYETPGYQQAVKKITVKAQMGVAMFSVNRY